MVIIVNCVLQDRQSAGPQYGGEVSLTIISLAIVSFLFVTVTGVFTVVLLRPDLCRRSRGSCTRTLQGTGRPASAAFERLHDAVQRCRNGYADDGQMLVVVGPDDGIADDVRNVASDDDSV